LILTMTIRLTQRILQYLTGNKNAPTQNRVGADFFIKLNFNTLT